MAYKNRDWYGHLVDQSGHDGVYDIIHGYLPHNWNPGHDLDFVVLSSAGYLGETGTPFNIHDVSATLEMENYTFPAGDYVLISNNRLTPYLDKARAARIIADAEGREFIELLFTLPKEEERPTYEDGLTTDAADWDMAPERDGAIFQAYERLRQAVEKEEAYRWAGLAEAWLDTKPIRIVDNVDASLFETKRKQFGYNVVAMVYAWNDRIDEAARVDRHYIHHPDVWDELNYLHTYLEMLMAKQQGHYLKHLFADDGFRRRFWPHYEAYVSLLVDNTYHFTRMMEAIPIINRVNNAYKSYI